MELIPASEFTIEQLVQVYNATRADYLVAMPMTVEALQRYLHVYDVDLGASILAMDGRRLLGLCLLGLRGSRAWVTRLGVLPSARRLGCARAMLETCMAAAEACGARRVQLEVIADNGAARHLFAQAGFHPWRRLLVLKRPAGLPLPPASPPDGLQEWLSADAALARAASRPWTPAWTNEYRSLLNAGGVDGLAVTETATGREGWACFQRGPAGLERVIVGPDTIAPAPGYSLLYHLHSALPECEAVAENVPVNVHHLDAFFALGYAVAFARVEMERSLGEDGEG